MSDKERAEAARQFSQAADSLVDACRRLEQLGLADPPIERLLQALEAVTHQVHRMHTPDQRIQIEPADMAVPGCRVAAAGAELQAACTQPPPDRITGE
ncbi:MAG: hypothetical protein ACOY93_03480 [Bacillota bacterium]